MTKNDWKLGVFAAISAAAFLGLAFFVGYMVVEIFAEDYTAEPAPEVTLTQELIDGPIPLVISCREERGAYHKLTCGVNADVKGRWLIRERIGGELRRGSQSLYAFNEWELAVGSDVSPTILIEFIPSGLKTGISLEYKLDTAYMRRGTQNFAGVNI
jgi:hypothetical protein